MVNILSHALISLTGPCHLLCYLVRSIYFEIKVEVPLCVPCSPMACFAYMNMLGESSDVDYLRSGLHCDHKPYKLRLCGCCNNDDDDDDKNPG